MRVDLADLRPRIDEFGPLAFMITVSPERMPHVVSAAVEWRPDGLYMGAGRHGRANLASGSVVTLVWPAPAEGAYSLIVDGDGDLLGDDEDVRVRPTSAILHKLVGVSGGPRCVPVTTAVPEG